MNDDLEEINIKISRTKETELIDEVITIVGRFKITEGKNKDGVSVTKVDLADGYTAEDFKDGITTEQEKTELMKIFSSALEENKGTLDLRIFGD
jgi:hypothetical protein